MNLWNDVFRKLTIPLLLTLVIALFYWVVPLVGFDARLLALHPRDPDYWSGIFTVPLVHGSNSHLINNLLAFMALSALLFVVYSRVAVLVLVLLWVGTGALMFVFARPEFFHIGASGVVYALIFFLFAVGILVRRRTPVTITLLVALYYGGAVWGIFPIEEGVSWDGHLMGAIAGVVCAWLFRRSIAALYPPEKQPVWFDESGEEDEEDEYQRFRDQN